MWSVKSVSALSGGKIPRIAVVDDDENIHMFLKDLAALGHYELPISSFTAGDALQRLLREQVDVVVMDIRLPDMSGVDCTFKLSTVLPDLPTVILTGYPDSQGFSRSLMAGARGFLVKPIGAQEFLNAIHEIATGGFPLAKQVVPFVAEIIHQFRRVGEEGLLTEREEEVLACLVRGLQDKEIASELGIGIRTVHTHVYRLLGKLDSHSRREVIEKFLRV